jgi:3-polyprenyl-4-hydroxybenzoate decarboxylase
MKTTDEYRQRLIAELIEQSAKIDLLVMKSRKVQMNYDQELEELRDKQRITTQKLHDLEDVNRTSWENIGDGG